MNKTPEEIIIKNCTFDKSDLRFASVKYYAESGSLSGSLYQSIKDSILEYAAQLTPQGEVKVCPECLGKFTDYFSDSQVEVREVWVDGLKDAIDDLKFMANKQTEPLQRVAFNIAITICEQHLSKEPLWVKASDGLPELPDDSWVMAKWILNDGEQVRAASKFEFEQAVKTMTDLSKLEWLDDKENKESLRKRYYNIHANSWDEEMLSRYGYEIEDNFRCWYEGYIYSKQTIPASPVAEGWVSVEDGLPELIEWLPDQKHSDYMLLATDSGVLVTAGYWTGSVWFTYGHAQSESRVTHWQPLPPPPQSIT